MTEVKIAVIVEGHGECEAVPILIRRIALEVYSGFIPQILHPIRIPASLLIKQGELERSIDLAARKLHGRGGIVVILDCDWNECCPAQMGPQLLARACKIRSDMKIAVVLAKKEFEAWFIAAAESLRGKRNLASDLQSPSNPENIRDAKGWLSARMTSDTGYSETDDQPALATVFDMSSARRADSFDKCYRDISSMIVQLCNQEKNIKTSDSR